MGLSEKLYQGFKLKRVYYSAYVPVSTNPNLPMLPEPPILREHRLYQADWLLRFYGFTARELLDSSHPNFDLELDPKANWALRNLHIFPVEINRADKNTLLRIPGIGHKSVMKIIAARKVNWLSFDDLKNLGVVLKRAKYFITCKGKYWGQTKFREDLLKNKLMSNSIKAKSSNHEQLTIFSFLDN
ncbi:putative DNA-binding helix-hairpin-helix protein [Desulfitispora alkaliphila]